jgi:hypothetical protein
MKNSVTVNETPEGYFAAYCRICGKHVERVDWEYKCEIVGPDPYSQRLQHTGEVIVSLHCHGSSIKVSNWRGVIEEIETFPHE